MSSKSQNIQVEEWTVRIEYRDRSQARDQYDEEPTRRIVLADIPGQFKVRASGGVRFATNAAETAGVQMLSGASQWLQLSDADSKHLFRELSGEDVLEKIARMPITEWSYKSQDASIRHIGPTAQDFHAAFGLGESTEHIGTLDAGGVALAAVKALESRSREMRARDEDLTAQADRLGRENAALTDRNAALEGALESLRQSHAVLLSRLEELERRLEKK